MMGQERCTRQLAQNVVRNARFLSNPQKEGQFTAKIATGRENSSKFFSNAKDWF